VDESTAKFFLFDSERASGIIFTLRLPVKMVGFHGEVTFISAFDSIRDIFETVNNTTMFITVQMYI
jgi:hypothetical protein